MKSQLNEVQRLQKIAGILIESNRINEEESEKVSPEEAAKEVSQVADKLESDPMIDKIAKNIAKDPKAKKELDSLLSKFGINPENINESMDAQVQKLALAMAQKAEKLSEEANYGGSLLAGLFGGGTLAYYIAKSGDVLTHMQQLLGQSPSHMTEAVIGAIAGAILAVVATKIYQSNKQ